MFEEVTHAAEAIGLVTRAHADPDTGGHRQRARHAFGGHREAGVKLCDPEVGHESAMTTSAAAVATIASTGVAAGFATGTEVAQLAGELGVERIVKRHGDGAIHGRCRGRSRGRRTLGTVAALAARATVAIARRVATQ